MPAHGLMNRPIVSYAPTTQAAYTVPSSPAGTDVIVTVGAGVTLSDSVRFAAGWGADCSVTVVVEDGGIVAGRGGNGGNGGNSGGQNGSNGVQGGHGIYMQQNLRLYVRVRGSGFVAGGGGGGGGGAGGVGHLGANSPGGGGGGGQGYPGGTHGNGGTTSGNNGTDGSTSTFGTGGAGISSGADGGDGGGLAGEAFAGSASNSNAGGSGGLPGAAIYSVGYPAPVILEGGDSAHIKGLIVTS